MYASNPNELKNLIEENPDEYPSSFLADESFAYHCYKNNSYVDLKELFDHNRVDNEQCSKWNITADQWKDSIEMALMAHYYESIA